MSVRNFRRDIRRAYSALSDAYSYATTLEQHLVFQGFEGHSLPEVRICSDCEIIVYWELEFRNGREIPIETALEHMEETGYITPADFGVFF